jgi:ABC-type uncharacterized transport system permease subunit
MVRVALATRVAPRPTAHRWIGLLRLAVTGLAAGAAAGFLAALLRPRRWIEYTEHPVASRS